MHLGYDASARWSDKIEDFYSSRSKRYLFLAVLRPEPAGKTSFQQFMECIPYLINERFGYPSWDLKPMVSSRHGKKSLPGQSITTVRVTKTLPSGDIKYKDQNGDSVINGMTNVPFGYRQGSYLV